MGRCFAALDVGSHGINAVSAEWSRSGDFILKGFCRVGSKGFRKGMVTDVEMATDSIAGALKKLKEKTARSFRDVFAGISSTSVNIIPSSGTLLLSRYGREISARDIKRCIEIASTIKTPLDREPLHRIVRSFSVDGESQIKNPLNLEGVKMGVDVDILTVNSSVAHNMSKCIAQSGFIPAGFVFSGLASAYRALTEEDKEAGVALLDICEDLTEVMVFWRGVLTDCKVFSVGTNEILTGSDKINTQVLKKLISQITSMSGWNKALKVVITGEGVLKDSLIGSLDRFFTCPVVVASCIARPFEDLPAERTGYIGSLGILDHLQNEKTEKRLDSNVIKRSFNSVLGFIDRYF